MSELSCILLLCSSFVAQRFGSRSGISLPLRGWKRVYTRRIIKLLLLGEMKQAMRRGDQYVFHNSPAALASRGCPLTEATVLGLSPVVNTA